MNGTAQPRSGVPCSGRRRTGAVMALAMILTVVLTGCLKMDMDLQVRADDTVDGTMVIAFDSTLLSATGQDPADAVQELLGSGSIVPSPGPGAVSAQPYNQDGKIGEEYTLTGVPITQFAAKPGDDSTLVITRTGDTFTVSGEMDLSSTGTSSGGTPAPSGTADAVAFTDDSPSAAPSLPFDPSALLGSIDVRVRITFPGEVISANGAIDGTSVTWTPKAGEKVTLQAVARASEPTGALGLSANSGRTAGIGAGVLIAVVVAGVLAFVLIRRRRTPVAAGTGFLPPHGPDVGDASTARDSTADTAIVGTGGQDAAGVDTTAYGTANYAPPPTGPAVPAPPPVPLPTRPENEPPPT